MLYLDGQSSITLSCANIIYLDKCNRQLNIKSGLVENFVSDFLKSDLHT